jgi:hypothetical protein
MAGLVPAIHVLATELGDRNVDARDKRGHDGGIEDDDQAFCSNAAFNIPI